MDVYLVDAVTGVEHVVSVNEDVAVAGLRATAHAVFNFPQGLEQDDLRLALDGQVLEDEDTLDSLPDMEEGCRVDVTAVGTRFLQSLANGIRLDMIPAWARALPECAIAALESDPQVLTRVDPALLKDKHVILAAVDTDSYALKWAHESLQNDRDVVLAAVQCNGNALQYALPEFRIDEEIVLAAVYSRPAALSYAHESFRKEKPLVLKVVSMQSDTLQQVDEALWQDKEVVMAAVRLDPRAFTHAHRSLLKDKEVIAAVRAGRAA